MANNSSVVEYIDHARPAWRSKADYIIHALVDESSGILRYEQLWTKKLDDNQYLICCIPFFAYDIALGDIVSTYEDPRIGRGDILYHRLDRSGHATFRIWLQTEDSQNTIPRWLDLHGHSYEWLLPGGRLIAVDTENAARAQSLADFLIEQEELGLLTYETGDSA